MGNVTTEDIGTIVNLDIGSAKSSQVILSVLGDYFATVKNSYGETWDVMANRLSRIKT